MKKVMMAVVIGVMIGNSSVWAVEYSFGQWAADTGLSTSATIVNAVNQGITNLDGLTSYTNLQALYLDENPLTVIGTTDFAGLSNLTDLRLSTIDYSVIESGVFSDMQNLSILYMNGHINIDTLNLNSARFRDITKFTIKDLNLSSVDLSSSELSQDAFNTLMDGGGSVFYGLAEDHHSDIIEMDFTSADFSDVEQLDRMHSMDALQILNLENVSFAPSIVSDNYNEVVQLIIALESGNLSFLTIDADLYTAQQTFFDEWDTGFLNDLTVVPEPTTLVLMGIGLLALRNRKS